MSDWTPKRFWAAARVKEVVGHGHQVLLDDRPLRTPEKAAFIVPTRALADLVAAEWDAQGDTVDPTTMPMTRMANSAIDRIGAKRSEVVEYIAAYGGTDLLCYRADHPQELVARQCAAWDPILEWAEAELGVSLRITTGIMPVEQPREVMSEFHDTVGTYDTFGLMGLHDLVGLTGSLVLGLAATQDTHVADDLWEASRIDEAWQIEQWGEDDEAADAASRKRNAFFDAYRFFHAAR